MGARSGRVEESLSDPERSRGGVEGPDQSPEISDCLRGPTTEDALPAWCYMLRLLSGTLYIGSTRKLEERCKNHFSGNGCRTTRIDPPVGVLYTEEFRTYSEALQRERQLKHWSRGKKEALIRGDMEVLHKLSRRRR